MSVDSFSLAPLSMHASAALPSNPIKGESTYKVYFARALIMSSYCYMQVFAVVIRGFFEALARLQVRPCVKFVSFRRSKIQFVLKHSSGSLFTRIYSKGRMRMCSMFGNLN